MKEYYESGQNTNLTINKKIIQKVRENLTYSSNEGKFYEGRPILT